jgi:hypothetical protein
MSGHDGGHGSDSTPEWVTVAQICDDLQVTADEWHAWRVAGDTPTHFRLPDGTFRVNASEYAFWLESRAVDDAGDPVRTDVRTEVDPVRTDARTGSPTGRYAPVRPRLAILSTRAEDIPHDADGRADDCPEPVARPRLYVVREGRL